MNPLMSDREEIRLAENLRKIMASRNLRVTLVAKKVGMNKSTLHGYCNGVVPRNLRTLKALADYFGVSFAELVFGSENEVPLDSGRGLEGRYEVTIRRIDLPEEGKR